MLSVVGSRGWYFCVIGGLYLRFSLKQGNLWDEKCCPERVVFDNVGNLRQNYFKVQVRVNETFANKVRRKVSHPTK